ncbi:MAG: FG-GAP-like repeat-containing protein [Bacteroidota bacterium]
MKYFFVLTPQWIPLLSKRALAFILAVILWDGLVAQPVISSFAPVSGAAGTHVVISGTGFSTNINDNIVSFGSIRASVLSAGNNQLTVVVPGAASYQPISIAVNNLMGYSAMPFNITFEACANFTDRSFDPRINVPITDFHLGFVTADMDGDGKIDVITSGNVSFSVMRNVGTVGSVSFSPQVNFPVAKSLRAVFTTDVNGDGKQDIVVFTNGQEIGFVVYTNQSTPGNLVFTPTPFVATGGYPTSLAAADFDGDGKTDLAISFLNSTAIGLVRNLSDASTINFSTPVYLSMGTMIAKDLTANDFNNDGKPDIAIASSGTNTDSLFVLTNNSLPGNISFQPRVKFADASKATGITSGDLDGDGRPDIAVVNYGKVSVFRNTGTGAVVNFGAAVNLDAWYSMQKIVIGDLNGDGKPEIVTAEQVLGFASLFANTSVPGNISFAPKVDYPVGYSASYLSIEDLDGDGKTDLLAGNIFDNSFYCFRSGQSSKIYLVNEKSLNAAATGLCEVSVADWNNASNDLQAVLNAAQPGDKIWVASGTYNPSTDFSGNNNPSDAATKTFKIKNGISLYGGFKGIEVLLEQRLPGQFVTTLNGKMNSGGNTVNANTVISFQNCDSTTVLSDFTITGGAAANAQPGGAFRLLQSSPVISNCIVSQNNATGRGAAFYLEDSKARIINTRITGNTAQYGAAIDMVRSNATIINCTIAKNAADAAAGLLLEEGSAPIIANTIIWGNIDKTGKQDNIMPVMGAVISYSIIALESGIYPGAGNMNANPIFADAANDVFSPVNGSPVIGTGNVAAYPANGPKTDLLGFTMPAQGTISIGAYQTAIPALMNASKVFYVNQNSTAVFATGLSWNDAFSNLNDALIVSNASGLVKEVWVAKGIYTPTHGKTGIPVGGTSKYAEATFLVKQINLYGGFSGSETSTAQRNVDANTTLLDGFFPDNGGYRVNHVVWVKGGQPVTVDGFSISRGAGDGFYGGGSLLAEYNPVTINNCKFFDNQRTSAVWIFGAPANISNSEFRDNYGSGGAIYSNGKGVNISNCYFHDNGFVPAGSFNYGYNGGAIYNAAGVMSITNTRFEKNLVSGIQSQGGAVYNSNSPYDTARISLKNCWLTKNMGSDGSAAYNQGGYMSLINCIVAKNGDNSTIGYGPLSTFSGRLEVINCSITDNSGTNTAGVTIDGYDYAPPTAIISNSIIWGNSSKDNARGVAVYNRLKPYSSDYSPGYSIDHSDIGLTTGLFPGTANFNSDPKFSDTAALNLQLLANSPCINTGNNASYTGNLATDTTLNGAARLSGDSIDIGALEYGALKISNGRFGLCTDYPAVTIDASNNNTWVPLNDEQGNAIAAIRANGNNLGLVNYSLFVRSGSPREASSGLLYLNRNVIISPDVQPATPVDLRIYITRQEFELLQTAINSKGGSTGIDNINDIAFYKNETHFCADTLEPATSVVAVTGSAFADGYMLTASIPSFSAFYMASATQSSLPLSLLGFSGRKVSGNIVLNWITTNEKNTYFFSVEKSTDGSHFESIGKLLAKNSSGENSYSFIDTAAFSGVVYYRLRQVDLDGKFVYSYIISIHGVNTTKGLVTVFPNPVTDIIQLQLNLPNRQQVEWTIIDNAGRTLQRGKIAAPSGILVTPVVTRGLSSGVYYLLLKGGNFEQKVKLVKVD